MPSQTLDVGPPELRLGWHQREENTQPVPRAQHEVRGCGEGMECVSTTAVRHLPCIASPVNQIPVGVPGALTFCRLVIISFAPHSHVKSLATHSSCRLCVHVISFNGLSFETGVEECGRGRHIIDSLPCMDSLASRACTDICHHDHDPHPASSCKMQSQHTSSRSTTCCRSHCPSLSERSIPLTAE